MTTQHIELGKFSISLAVADLDKALAFYKTLGFEPFAGEAKDGWLILREPGEKAFIGLFCGMFEDNLLTFNPPDARAVQAVIEGAGYPIVKKAEPGEGPAHLVVEDPDGNTILIDQHE
jgi:catechol 2,3-dioxygenase-like lactoylglutathione lyase family enzyme